MQAYTKEWLTHCVVPHNMHEVSEEFHDMMHDHMFFMLNAAIVILFLLAIIMSLGIWFAPSGTEMPYMHYMPLGI